MTGLFENNYGIIENIQVNILECTKLANIKTRVVGHDNYGTISNFIINYLFTIISI